MNDKRFYGLLSASTEKRYKSFITTIADKERVYLLKNSDGYATIDMEDIVGLIVYPEKEYADYFKSQEEDESVETLSTKEFLNRCKDIIDQDKIMFAVFPTEKNCYFAPVEKVYYDLLNELELIE